MQQPPHRARRAVEGLGDLAVRGTTGPQLRRTPTPQRRTRFEILTGFRDGTLNRPW
jgi:hypothetical protein